MEGEGTRFLAPLTGDIREGPAIARLLHVLGYMTEKLEVVMEWEFEQLIEPYGDVTEGPAWDGRAMIFTHGAQNRIMRYDPQSGQCAEYYNGLRSSGLAFDANGRLYACCGGERSILRLEPDGSNTTVVDRLDGRRLNAPNDLAIDSRGRVWFTNPCYWGSIDPSELELDHEEVLRADPQLDGTWSLRRMTYDMTKPNGILISPDQRTMYVAQTNFDQGERRELRAYPIQEDGSLGEYIVLHQFGEDHRGTHRGIDGMCLDSEGNIVATAGWHQSGPGPMIYVFAPSGQVLEAHPLPVDRPTNCAFGDPDLGTLYITTFNGHFLRVRNTGRKGWILWPPST